MFDDNSQNDPAEDWEDDPVENDLGELFEFDEIEDDYDYEEAESDG